jgi:hypothetical protein
VEQYGYCPCDLIYFRDPTKDLVVGLHLVSSDYDMAYMASKHVETHIVELYIVSFRDDGGGDGKDGEDDEEEDVGGRVNLNDPWWDHKISDDDDVFEDDCNVDRVGPSTDKGVEGDGEDGDGSEGTGVDGTGFEGTGFEGTDVEGECEGDGRSGPSTSSHHMYSFEEVEADDNNSETGRIDILLSPPISDEKDYGISSHPSAEFHEVDIVNPNLKLKMKFSSLQLFGEAVKQYNVKRGKYVKFEKKMKEPGVLQFVEIPLVNTESIVDR